MFRSLSFLVHMCVCVHVCMSDCVYVCLCMHHVCRFMNRVAMQPVLRKDADFIDFLENPNDVSYPADLHHSQCITYKSVCLVQGGGWQ